MGYLFVGIVYAVGYACEWWPALAVGAAGFLIGRGW